MTQISIQTQVDAIKKVTQEALQSKETALQFLIDAGIIRDNKTEIEERTPAAPTRRESAPRKKKD